MNTREVMEYLFSIRVNNLPPEALAEVFDRLIWCVQDNGNEICEVRNKWIEEGDFEKCSIALTMAETFPYETLPKMEEVFGNVVKKHPELESKCNQIINRFKAQNA